MQPGDVLDVEKLPADEGSSVEFTDVLAVSRDGEVIFGSPLVPEASVHASVRAQVKDDKVIVFKYKRKTRYRRKKGHRQAYTRLAITAIMLGGEGIGVSGEEAPSATVQEEPTSDEVADELEGQAPGEEISGALEDGSVEEPMDEIGDQPQDDAIAETAGETNDQPAREPEAEAEEGRANGP